MGSPLNVLPKFCSTITICCHACSSANGVSVQLLCQQCLLLVYQLTFQKHICLHLLLPEQDICIIWLFVKACSLVFVVAKLHVVFCIVDSLLVYANRWDCNVDQFLHQLRCLQTLAVSYVYVFVRCDIFYLIRTGEILYPPFT